MLGTREKIVYYEPSGRIHPSQWDLINYPPDGYKFIVQGNRIGEAVVGNTFVFDKLRLQVLDRLMPLNLFKSKIDDIINRVPDGTSLLYLYNHTTLRKIPWVVNIEWAHILVGRDLSYFGLNKSVIEKRLASDYCRAILTWTETAKRSILLNYDCTEFKHKMRVVLPATHSADYDRDYNRGRVRLLFVGALRDPMSFDAKGGWETVQVFLKLCGQYPDLELTLRTLVPEYVRTRLSGMRNVRILSEVLSLEEMEDEFCNADIFIAPSHKFQNMAVLDAMRWGLPTVTTDIGSSSEEFITNEETGLVVSSPKEMPYITDNFILTSETTQYGKLIKAIRRHRHKTVDALARATGYLIEHPEMREKLGMTAKREVDDGRFSLTRRNDVLKEIFDEATDN